MSSESIARAFHEAYERLAPEHGYKTREASAKPWEEVPEQNKALMRHVVQTLMDEGVFYDPEVTDVIVDDPVIDFTPERLLSLQHFLASRPRAVRTPLICLDKPDSTDP